MINLIEMKKIKTDLEKAEKKVDKRKMEMIPEGLSFFGLKENSMIKTELRKGFFFKFFLFL